MRPKPAIRAAMVLTPISWSAFSWTSRAFICGEREGAELVGGGRYLQPDSTCLDVAGPQVSCVVERPLLLVLLPVPPLLLPVEGGLHRLAGIQSR